MAVTQSLFHATFQVVVIVLICCGTCFFNITASQDTDKFVGDEQSSAQYYRPYYNNRRPVYPAVSLPYYNNYRPSHPSRPSKVPTGTCSSTNSYQQFGICWASDSQRLEIGPNLTIENLVRFYTTNLYSSFIWSPKFFQQFCEQTRRFNSVGVMCVTDDEDNCISNRGTASALRCINDNCMCVVGEPYETIAQSITPPNEPVNCAPGNFACVYKQTQTILDAAGIYWRPPG